MLDSEYVVNDILKDLNAIFDAAIFENVYQEPEQDTLVSTELLPDPNDVEKLLEEDDHNEILSESSETKSSYDDDECEKYSQNLKRNWTGNSPKRNVRLRSPLIWRRETNK